VIMYVKHSACACSSPASSTGESTARTDFQDSEAPVA
jgi:hypothetical protein